MKSTIPENLLSRNASRIVLLVMDGLGGLPLSPGSRTELEAASTPNLDRLAVEGICGLHQPVAPGITPGSGPAHLALFGYDPLDYRVGRGVLSALGIDFDLRPGDVAARGNFCTVDEAGRVTDRRAGRISSEKNHELIKRLSGIRLEGAEVYLRTVKEYRFLLVLRGEGLSGDLEDTDPQETGVPPVPVQARSDDAGRTAELVKDFLRQAKDLLKDQDPANMALLRGFSELPDWPGFPSRYGLRAAAIAGYPMYRGVSKLVGMEVLETGSSLEDEFDTLEAHWEEYDFFFLHVKPVDSAGEDGDFDRKAAEIEKVDRLIPRLRALQPDVILVTGDHSTPSLLKSHSWHPVPVLLWSNHCRRDGVEIFGERACMAGGLGPRIPAPHLLPLALANALRLEKFGA